MPIAWSSPNNRRSFKRYQERHRGQGNSIIKVGGCGLCHTDSGLMRRTAAEWADMPPPFSLGHEVAGWVEEIGQGVVGFKTGQPVAVLPVWGSCGHCPPSGAVKKTFAIISRA